MLRAKWEHDSRAGALSPPPPVEVAPSLTNLGSSQRGTAGGLVITEMWTSERGRTRVISVCCPRGFPQRTPRPYRLPDRYSFTTPCLDSVQLGVEGRRPKGSRCRDGLSSRAPVASRRWVARSTKCGGTPSAGRSGIAPISRFDARGFPVRIAAEVRGWDLSAVGLSPSQWRKHPPQTHFAVGAALQAIRIAQLDERRPDPLRFGVYFGCGETFPEIKDLAELMAAAIKDGALDAGEFNRRAMADVDPEQAMNCEPHIPAHLVAGLVDAQGPNFNCIAACASSTQAIGNAANLIRRGDADVMLAGGAHSMIHPLGITGLCRLAVLSTANERMEKAMRPFDADRNGFVVGEGGAVVVLESLEHARARGADIWGELTGFACGHDAFNLTDTHPEGRGFARSVCEALRQARLNVDDVDYVNAHGTSTRMNDRIETLALKRALGAAAYRIPVSSTKSMMGHATTACGAIELVAVVMAIRRGVIPPTINYETPDPECDLDYVPNAAREHRCRHALNVSLGFGGQCAALVVSQFADKPAGSLSHAA